MNQIFISYNRVVLAHDRLRICFHLVSRKLDNDALKNNMTHENYEQFSSRVKSTLEKFPVATIDNIIESMNKCLSLLVKSKGQRLMKY